MIALLSRLVLGAVTRFPVLARVPWRLIGLLVLAMVLLGTGWTVRGWREDSARAAVLEQRERQYQAELRRRAERDVADARAAQAVRSTLEARIAELAALPPRTLVQTKTVTVHDACDCPVPTLGPEFWLRWRTAGADAPAGNVSGPVRGAVPAPSGH